MRDRKVIIKTEKINWYAKLDLFNDNEKTLFNGVIATNRYKINNIENIIQITQSTYDKILKTGTIKLRVWKDRYPDEINCYEWHVFKVENLYMETLTVEEIKI